MMLKILSSQFKNRNCKFPVPETLINVAALSPCECHRKFNTGSKSIPHKAKAAKGGEDAHIEMENAMVVCDGVSSWSALGVDTALFSRELVDNISGLLNKGTSSLPLGDLFQQALEATNSTGSSTCSIVNLDEENDYLHTLILGDTGYIIIRPRANGESSLVFKSKEQQHIFNCPFQVGTEGDSPSTAISATHFIRNNDIVVLASDGLWDNVFEERIQEIVDSQLEKEGNLSHPEELAEALAEEAYKIAYSFSIKTPFGEKAAENGYEWRDGKPDDITVSVGQIIIGSPIDDISTQVEDEENLFLDDDIDSDSESPFTFEL